MDSVYLDLTRVYIPTVKSVSTIWAHWSLLGDIRIEDLQPSEKFRGTLALHSAQATISLPTGPCAQIVHTLDLKSSLQRHFRAEVYTVRVKGTFIEPLKEPV